MPPCSAHRSTNAGLVVAPLAHLVGVVVAPQGEVHLLAS